MNDNSRQSNVFRLLSRDVDIDTFSAEAILSTAMLHSRARNSSPESPQKAAYAASNTN
jgi:hypothetical protein